MIVSGTASLPVMVGIDGVQSSGRSGCVTPAAAARVFPRLTVAIDGSSLEIVGVSASDFFTHRDLSFLEPLVRQANLLRACFSAFLFPIVETDLEVCPRKFKAPEKPKERKVCDQ
jgi:hypothetical protein